MLSDIDLINIMDYVGLIEHELKETKEELGRVKEKLDKANEKLRLANELVIEYEKKSLST